MAIETDAEVIRASVDQPERFESIFDRHAARVYRYLRRRVGAALAEELVGETFTRAFRARADFGGSRPTALPWLYGIALNLVRMHVRAERRRERAYRASAAEPVVPLSTSDVDARLDARALGPALDEALAALPTDQREVLLLHAWAGLSPGEIAEALSISTITARTRLHRARVKAAERLERAVGRPDGSELPDSIFERRTAP